MLQRDQLGWVWAVEITAIRLSHKKRAAGAFSSMESLTRIDTSQSVMATCLFQTPRSQPCTMFIITTIESA